MATSRAWRFCGGNATEKQRNYIDALAQQAGYGDGHTAARRYFGWSSSKLDRRGLDRQAASAVIDWLQTQIVPKANDDPEVQALRRQAGEDRDVDELRKIAEMDEEVDE